MAENIVEKPTSLPEECEKEGGHRWIFKERKYICEYCFKESESFKELKQREDALARDAFGKYFFIFLNN